VILKRTVYLFALVVVLLSPPANALSTQFVLPDSKWHQISLPVTPDPAGTTVRDLFGDELNPDDYGNVWGLFSYDPTAVPAAYVDLGIDGVLQKGVAYWMIQKTGSPVTLDISNYVVTASGDFEVALVAGNNTVWNMVGFPHDAPIDFRRLIVRTDSGDCADADGCTIDEASQLNIVANQFFSYNGSAYETTESTPAAHTLTPWKGYWVAALAGANGLNPKLTFPARWALNDTGLLTGEDGQTGRDATHNDNSNGFAGFDFTKLDTNGTPVSSGSWSCVKDNVTGLIWEVKTTDGGLHDKNDKYVWYDPAGGTGFQQASQTIVYSGDTSKNNTCAGYDPNDASTYCNTYAYLQRVNAQGWCGANDWRLPTREELRSLVKMDSIIPKDNVPAIDLDYFPNTTASHKIDCVDIIYIALVNQGSSPTGSSNSTVQGVINNLLVNDADYAQACQSFDAQSYQNHLNGQGNATNPRGRGVGYATQDLGAENPEALWTIFFDDKEIDHEITYHDMRYIRLVRGGKVLDNNSSNSNEGRFVNNQDGTATDMLTGLTWKRCLEGYTLDDNSTPGDITDDHCNINGTTNFSWQNALALKGSSFANSNAWRVPNLKELTSLTVHSGPIYPATSRDIFPDTPNLVLWTSSEHSGNTNNAWGVNFGNGGDRVHTKSGQRPVRLVRD